MLFGSSLFFSFAFMYFNGFSLCVSMVFRLGAHMFSWNCGWRPPKRILHFLGPRKGFLRFFFSLVLAFCLGISMLTFSRTKPAKKAKQS